MDVFSQCIFQPLSANAQPLPTVPFEVTRQAGQITLIVSQNPKQKDSMLCCQNLRPKLSDSHVVLVSQTPDSPKATLTKQENHAHSVTV